MGCCNKQKSGKPIGRRRYYGGLLLLGGAQLGVLGALHAISVPLPRYRKLLPFYHAYARETFTSVWRRDRIRVQDEPDIGDDLEDCAIETAP